MSQEPSRCELSWESITVAYNAATEVQTMIALAASDSKLSVYLKPDWSLEVTYGIYKCDIANEDWRPLHSA